MWAYLVREQPWTPPPQAVKGPTLCPQPTGLHGGRTGRGAAALGTLTFPGEPPWRCCSVCSQGQAPAVLTVPPARRGTLLSPLYRWGN